MSVPVINDCSAFHQAESHFFAMLSRAKMSGSHWVAYATGAQVSSLNPAIFGQVDQSIVASVAHCQAFYAKQQVPWVLVLPEYFHDETVGKLLQRHGLTLSDKGVAMSVLLENIQLPSFDLLLKIREVQDDLETWSVPLLEGFESTPEITNTYAKQHFLASSRGEQLRHFSGFIEDTVVCSLSVSWCDAYARIDDVATIPAYQNQGYATQLIYAALQYMQQLNISQCFLEASATGLNLYKRIGFEPLFMNHYYEIR